jgi:outer membrane cobalamin receptor
MSLRLAVVCLACLLLTSGASAQTAGELSGTVRAPDGTPLSQLVLRLDGPSGPRRVVTGVEGRYHLGGLPPGEYDLDVDVPGFVVEPHARVTVGASAVRLDLTLSPAPLSEQVLVSAVRGEALASTLGVSASVIEGERLAEREAPLLLPVLEEVPGLAVARTGGPGRQGSAFIRGGESRFARILVDGVPVNEPGGAYDFGASVPLEMERIEVVRGAASSLYGTDALAGVIHMVTRRPRAGEPARVALEADGGSFGWRRGHAGTSGRRSAFDWTLGAQWLETDSQGDNAFFRQTSAAGALGLALRESTNARLTVRLEDSDTGTPGQVAFGRPDLDAHFQRLSLVAGLELRHTAGGALHEVRAGLAASEQLTLNPLDSGPFLASWEGRTGAFPIPDFVDAVGFHNDSDRLSFGYRVERPAGSSHLLTAGVDVERETGALGSAELQHPRRTNVGGYVQDRMLLGERVHLTLGGRLEHNGSFGTRAVPRLAVAWRPGGEDTVVRASAGAGIKEPDFFQSFGSPFTAGNPDLDPERSRTFDLGIERRLLGGRLRVEATAFHHDYLDQIAFTVVDFTTFEGMYVNIGRTRARGLELAAQAAPRNGLRVLAQYTLLDGEVRVSPARFNPLYAVGRPLVRRPRHQGSLTAQAGNARASAGATLVAVGRRADSDFAGLDLMENAGYARLDVRARVRVAGALTAFAVGENVTDRRYQEALGYPAPGRALRLGLRWSSARE